MSGGERAGGDSAPSFAALLGEAHARKEHPIVRRMFDKVELRRLLEELGAPVVDRFELLGPLERLHPSMLTTPAVIKPRRGSNNRGVTALQPVAPGRWRDVLGEREHEFEGIRGMLSTALVTMPLHDEWVIEDLMPGDPPGTPVDDVKFCVFGDDPVCAFVRANDPRGFQWFDADWQPIDTGVHAIYRRGGLTVPPHREALTETAREIGRQLALPFIRIDFLVNRAGFVVGELTPYPGWFRDFSVDWDTIFGEHYQRAEAALRATTIGAKTKEYR
jgi:hypothetical protein